MAQGKIDRNGRLHEPPGSEKGGNFAPENGVKTVNDSAQDKSIKQLEEEQAREVNRPKDIVVSANLTNQKNQVGVD